jgi:FMN-dependent oxidoreductase (nitrilotriacetate monooxygenase family)
MSDPAQTMNINLFIHEMGHHEAAWRLPQSRPRAVVDLEHYRHAVSIAEGAKLDSIFFADTLTMWPSARHNLRSPLEPISLLSALAATTSRIGLIATASTGFQDPYNLARRFATLDHLSNGRAGWNIVTSGLSGEARNFGLDSIPDHADRYRRAEEFVEVANGLWDGWEEGTLVGDKESGLFVDTERVRAIEHEGEFFKVAGPLGVPRSPQVRPVLVQAGSSESGMDFAARYAEAVFTAQPTIEDARAFYADLKARTEGVGRDRGQIVILPGYSPLIGSTEEETRRREQEFQDLIVTDHALGQLSMFLQHEVTEADLDHELPLLPGEDTIEGHKARFSLIVDMARAEQLTVRQLIGRLAWGRGHFATSGTPEQIAAEMELWFRSGACDGFNYMPPSIPDQLEVFVDNVVPILQGRGFFRTEYKGTTLRDHYGLDLPAGHVAERTEALTAR